MIISNSSGSRGSSFLGQLRTMPKAAVELLVLLGVETRIACLLLEAVETPRWTRGVADGFQSPTVAGHPHLLLQHCLQFARCKGCTILRCCKSIGTIQMQTKAGNPRHRIMEMGSSTLRMVLVLLGAGLKQSQNLSVSSPAPVTMVRLPRRRR